MQFVDEHDDVRVLGELLHDRLQPLLELTAVLGARDDQRDVERQQTLVREEVRHVAVDDLLGEPFDDGGLADAGFADQDGVVLGAAAEHLLHAFDFVFAPDQRIELVLHRRLGEVAAELREQRRFLHARERRLLVQQLHDVVAHRVQPHPLFHQDGGRHGSLFAQDAEQQVLGADVAVEELVRFFGRVLQHALRLAAEGDLHRRGDLLAEHRAPFDFLADAVERQVRALEDSAGQTLAFTDEPQQEMLRLNRDAPELAGFISREEENPSRPFRVAFEHPRTLIERSDR